MHTRCIQNYQNGEAMCSLCEWEMDDVLEDEEPEEVWEQPELALETKPGEDCQTYVRNGAQHGCNWQAMCKQHGLLANVAGSYEAAQRVCDEHRTQSGPFDRISRQVIDCRTEVL
jgi:hypothetical protein